MTISLFTVLMVFGLYGLCLWAACMVVVFLWAVFTVLALAGSWAVRRWRR